MTEEHLDRVQNLVKYSTYQYWGQHHRNQWLSAIEQEKIYRQKRFITLLDGLQLRACASFYHKIFREELTEYLISKRPELKEQKLGVYSTAS